MKNAMKVFLKNFINNYLKILILKSKVDNKKNSAFFLSILDHFQIIKLRNCAFEPLSSRREWGTHTLVALPLKKRLMCVFLKKRFWK